ncbi:hypothetical protein V8F20_006078 [Naviculisporaceae sp. PSN 640]
MKSFATILSLVASASAIDLYAYSNYGCSGNWARCTNLNPNVCCQASGSSVSALGIPIGWHITLIGSTGGGCNTWGASNTNNGQSNVCVNGGYYTGEWYRFNGRKRAEDSAVGSDCQKPDILGLADGSEFDLSTLAEDELDALLELGLNATTIADVPAEIKSLQIK